MYSQVEENESLKEKVNNDKKLIKDLENRCILWELENKNLNSLKSEIDEKNTKIKEMEAELKKIEELEVQLQKETEKTKSLTNQIKVGKNNFSS